MCKTDGCERKFLFFSNYTKRNFLRHFDQSFFSFTPYSLLLNNGLEGFYQANAAVANDIAAAQQGGAGTVGESGIPGSTSGPTTVVASSRAVNGYEVPDMEEMDTSGGGTASAAIPTTAPGHHHHQQPHRSHITPSAILPIANPSGRQQQRRRVYPGTQNRPAHLQRLI